MTHSEILKIAKPILLNTNDVLAILDGRKTVTRRVVRYKYDNTEMKMKTDKYGTRLIEIQKDIEGETHGTYPDGRTWRKILPYIEPKAPYKLGCYLYVRETWGIGNLFYDDEDIPNLCVCYKASEDRIEETCTTFKITDEQYEKYDNRVMSMQDWYSCVSMPKEAARIFLRVKDVKAERLQEIDGNGVLTEGIDNGRSNPAMGKRWDNMQRMTFENLWDSTIQQKDRDKYGWEANPFVWVIEFERVEVQG